MVHSFLHCHQKLSYDRSLSQVWWFKPHLRADEVLRKASEYPHLPSPLLPMVQTKHRLNERHWASPMGC